MKYLIDTTEIYRIDSEVEADQLLETAKASGVLNKYNLRRRARRNIRSPVLTPFLRELKQGIIFVL